MSNTAHKHFFALLNQMLHANKEDLVFAYSSGTTTSLSEFYRTDRVGYNLMIDELQKRVKLETERETKKLRSAILTRLQRYGVNTTDWTEVNRFLSQPKIARKKLYEMSHEEMHALIKKMESILSKNAREMQRIKEITQSN